MDKKEIGLMLKAAQRLVPESSRRSKRYSFTIEMLDAIGSSFDLTDFVNACFWSWLATTFYATARTGKSLFQHSMPLMAVIMSNG